MLAAPAPARPPVEKDSTDPSTASHTRLFFVVFDCSLRNERIGPTEPTTVHQIHDQLKSLEKETDSRVHAERSETDCARANWFTRPDQGRPVIDDRLEQMYQRLAAQTELWLEQTPIAQISVVSMGGSWGATQAAEFSRMLHERGIRADLAGRETGDAPQPQSCHSIQRPSQLV